MDKNEVAIIYPYFINVFFDEMFELKVFFI